MIGDYERIEIAVQALQAGLDHAGDVVADGVHLGVKFAAQNSVTEINEAGPGIVGDFFRTLFEGFEDDDARRFGNFSVLVGSGIKGRDFAGRRFVERLAAGGEQASKQGRQVAALGGPAARDGLDAERIAYFEWAELPAEAPAHGAIEVSNGISDLGHAPRGIKRSLGDQRPKELLRLVPRLTGDYGAQYGLEAGAGVVDGACDLE